MIEPRPVESLTPADAMQHHVWRFVPDEMLSETIDETFVVPESEPVDSLDSKVILTEVALANGNMFPAMINNVFANDRKKTQIFIDISLFYMGIWFDIPRVIDSDYSNEAVVKIADALGIEVDDMFPIHYDLRQYVIGEGEGLFGNFTPVDQNFSDEDLARLLV